MNMRKWNTSSCGRSCQCNTGDSNKYSKKYVWRLVQQIRVSNSTTWKIYCDNLSFFPYKMQLSQSLSKDGIAICYVFARGYGALTEWQSGYLARHKALQYNTLRKLIPAVPYLAFFVTFRGESSVEPGSYAIWGRTVMGINLTRLSLAIIYCGDTWRAGVSEESASNSWTENHHPIKDWSYFCRNSN